MVNVRITSWAAIAPDIKGETGATRFADFASIDKDSFKKIPPLLRRRFNTLGKCAMAAVLQLLNDGDYMPSVFASRHGDTALTLSLLEGIGRDEDMSPTNFSLAVHNAVSGLYTMARKDTSAVTAIASADGLIVSALLESAGLLTTCERVLCVIYDLPLPALYQRYMPSVSFPYAIALILSHSEGIAYTLEQQRVEDVSQGETVPEEELQQFLDLLTGASMECELKSNGTTWSMKKE